ncbi:hypothetical protein [Aquimarina agarivorans]|uniref:hypothetical protein n=1 Tax=Aquimarina agarivorans TaxID=980584 RepID=UPI000248E8CE|nr:hypothetical protein [Aquimarina agarivorans]
MNKIFKTLIFLGLIFSLVECNPTKKNIVITQKKSKESIVLRMESKYNTVFGIKFPQKLEFENKSLSNKSFVMVNYQYEDSLTKWRNLGIELYTDELERISNNKKKIISSKTKLSYILYTRHFIDSTSSTQAQFKTFIKKMLSQNKDTLHIGTVKEFKKTHKELFEKLTKNDSISIQFLEGKKLGERVTVPVKW